MSPQPPRLAVRLLANVLRRDPGDVILGDLTEEYADRVERGAWLNTLWFWGHAVAFTIAAARRPSSLPPSKEHFGMSRIRTGLYHALRRLSHDWRYSAAVILILAVGIGPAAAMLSVVERVLLRPLDYWQPDRLALIRLSLGQLRDHPGISPAEAIDLRTAKIFEAVEVQQRLSEVTLSVQDQLVPLTMVRMTTGMLPLFKIPTTKSTSACWKLPVIWPLVSIVDWIVAAESSRLSKMIASWRSMLLEVRYSILKLPSE